MSPGLQMKFHLLELASFDEWRRSGPQKRAEIARNIGQYEAKEIIREIDEEVGRKIPTVGEK